MGTIEDIYADLETDISEEEFREAVEDKVEQMGGLADEETAAMLIAHELTDQQVGGIADIEPGMEEVKFLGKVTSIGDLREFDRDDEQTGRVVNVEVADETGSIRAAFWDEMAESATEELEVGQVLRIQGRPRDGFNGVEVSVSKAEPDPDADIDVLVKDVYQVTDLTMGRSDVTLRGQVLDTEPIRTFDRDDGTEGRVSNIVLGDETGRLRVTLWDDKADLAEQFEPGESVEVVDGYVRERDGDLELHVGRQGTVDRIDADVDYVPDTTDIEVVEIDETVDLAGVVRSADPKRTFQRDDGSDGQVKNIRVQDKTGDIRVALWGEKADIEVSPGDEIQLADVEIQEGWQDDLEASAGWRSTVTVLADGPGDTPTESIDTDDNDSPSLDEFDGADATEPEGEAVEFTGVVVQAGDPVMLDNGSETLSVVTDSDVQLGQEVTVRGTRRGGRVEADEVL
jgi:replication factor A1